MGLLPATQNPETCDEATTATTTTTTEAPAPTCTLELGTVVTAPWFGKNEGSKSCKTFSCIGSPTGAVLLPAAQNVKGPCSNTCTLELGTVVVAPWFGKNEGDKSCKTFSCIGTPTGAQL